MNAPTSEPIHRRHLYHYTGEVRSRLRFAGSSQSRLGDFLEQMDRYCGASLAQARLRIGQQRRHHFRLLGVWGMLAAALAVAAVAVTGVLSLHANPATLRIGGGLGLLAVAAGLMALRAWDAAAGRDVLLGQIAVWEQALAAAPPGTPWPTGPAAWN